MNGKSKKHPSGIIVLSHSVSSAIDHHRSREFAKRMEFFAEHYGFVHIISLNPSSNGKTVRASKTHDIYITSLKLNSLRDQIQLSHFLQRTPIAFVDTESDMFHNLFALILSRTRPVLFFQGLVIDQFLLSLNSSKTGRVVRPILRVFASIFERISLQIPREIICVSKGILNHTSNIIGASKKTRVHYLPHSLNDISDLSLLDIPKRIEDAARKGTAIISYLGRLEKSKRVDVAVKTVSVLLEKGHSVVLVIMGTGAEKSNLSRLAQKLGIASRIIFTGHLDRESALSVLAKSRAMIFPSESEGFSWAVIESLAMGCPVVSHKYRTSLDDGLDRAVVLIDSLDPNTFSNEVERILIDDNHHISLVESGLRFSKPFTSITQKDRFSRISHIIDSQ
jgi:glycosyltransferase involved in cell wall biosynthesis